MVIVRLIGGLGNQMFQYALGRRLAVRHSTPLKLDLSWFAEQTDRQYCLDHFKIKAEIASANEIARATHSLPNGFLGRAQQSVERWLPYYLRGVVQERSFTFDSQVFRTRKNVYLTGYWQSEKYFKEIESTIREEFELKQDLSAEGHSWLKAICASDRSVSVHVRRGDYVSNPQFNRILGVCTPEYYIAAAAQLETRVYRPNYFLFSDDTDWARKNLSFPGTTAFIDRRNTSLDYEDLYLMSQCKHHIIANSSFSWWGAWLGRFPDKLTIAPGKWFEDRSLNTRDLIPDAWLRL